MLHLHRFEGSSFWPSLDLIAGRHFDDDDFARHRREDRAAGRDAADRAARGQRKLIGLTFVEDDYALVVAEA
jgi:hypothetical protein